MKKVIAIGIVIAGIAVAIYLYMIATAPILGTYKTSEQLGEIEFRPNGKAYFKKYDMLGDVRADGRQVSVNTKNATFFFTKQPDGTLIEGVAEPSKKILPPPPEPPKKVKDQMEKWKRLEKEGTCPFCNQKIPAGQKLNFEPWGIVPPPPNVVRENIPQQQVPQQTQPSKVPQKTAPKKTKK